MHLNAETLTYLCVYVNNKLMGEKTSDKGRANNGLIALNQGIVRSSPYTDTSLGTRELKSLKTGSVVDNLG